jgi:N-acetylmuramoyl-L-alanine amidase
MRTFKLPSKPLIGKYKPKKYRKLILKYSFSLFNFAVFASVAGLVIYFNAPDTQNVNGLASIFNSTKVRSADEVSSVDLALKIAKLTSLPQTLAVVNQADSFSAQLSAPTLDDRIISKPQIVSTALKSQKDIAKYKAIVGDSVPALATKFNVSQDSIRWSNSIAGDTVAPGADLLIPPVTGLVYEAKEGDSVENIATRFRADKDSIIAYNDKELSGIKPGEKLVIPDGVVYIAPVVIPTQVSRAATSNRTTVGATVAPTTPNYSFTPTFNANSGFNGYDYGYCTWYVANKRIAIGRPIPTNLGHASTWRARAIGAGMSVGSTPAPGAVAWKFPRDYYGHVAYVESVNADGSFLISEMNVVGWNRLSTKVVPASGASSWQFIY